MKSLKHLNKLRPRGANNTNKECGTEKGQQVDVSIELLLTQT